MKNLQDNYLNNQNAYPMLSRPVALPSVQGVPANDNNGVTNDGVKNPLEMTNFDIKPESTNSVDEAPWVDASNKIINTNKDDPYLQLEQIYKLRIQYMKQVHSYDLKDRG